MYFIWPIWCAYLYSKMIVLNCVCNRKLFAFDQHYQVTLNYVKPINQQSVKRNERFRSTVSYYPELFQIVFESSIRIK